MRSLYKDKRGFLPALVGLPISIMFALIIAVVLIVAGALIFLTVNKFVIIGGGLIALVLIFGFRGGFNRTKAIFMGSVIVLGLVFILASGTLQNVFGDEDVIYVVDSGRFECSEQSVEMVIPVQADQGVIFTCGQNVLIDDCKVDVECGDTSFLNSKCDGAYRKNGGSWVRYKLSEFEKRQITTLQPGQKIEFARSSIILGGLSGGILIPSNEDKTTIEYSYNPYQLFTIERGKKVPTNSNDCCLVNQNKITRTDVSVGDYDCLNKGDSRNYFLNWERVYGFKIYDYRGDDVLCSTNTLYKIIEEPLADGTTRKIQGNIIKSVDCCPHQDNNCDLDFEFLPVEEEREIECSIDSQCSNSGDPQFTNSQTEAIFERCESGECVQKVLEIECNSNAVCIDKFGDNFVCSQALSTFGKCIESKIGQSYCGDGTCNVGESFGSCPKDCSEDTSCEWYQESYTKTEKDYGFAYWRAYTPGFDPLETEVSGCKTAGWVMWSIIGAVVVILGSVAIISTRPKKAVRKAKRGRK